MPKGPPAYNRQNSDKVVLKTPSPHKDPSHPRDTNSSDYPPIHIHRINSQEREDSGIKRDPIAAATGISLIGGNQSKKPINIIRLHNGISNVIPTFVVNSTMSSEGSSNKSSSASSTGYNLKSYPSKDGYTNHPIVMYNTPNQPSSAQYQNKEMNINSPPSTQINGFSFDPHYEKSPHLKNHLLKAEGDGTRRSYSGAFSDRLEVGPTNREKIFFENSIENVHSYREQKDRRTDHSGVYTMPKREGTLKEKSKDGRYSLGLESELRMYEAEKQNKNPKINEVRDWEAFLEKNRKSWEKGQELTSNPGADNIYLMKASSNQLFKADEFKNIEKIPKQKVTLPLHSYYDESI
jgi:hypothetical protein